MVAGAVLWAGAAGPTNSFRFQIFSKICWKFIFFSLFRSVPSSPGEGATVDDCQPKVFLRSVFSKTHLQLLLLRLWPALSGPPHTNRTSHWPDLAVGQLCAPSSPQHPPSNKTTTTTTTQQANNNTNKATTSQLICVQAKQPTVLNFCETSFILRQLVAIVSLFCSRGDLLQPWFDKVQCHLWSTLQIGRKSQHSAKQRHPLSTS